MRLRTAQRCQLREEMGRTVPALAGGPLRVVCLDDALRLYRNLITNETVAQATAIGLLRALTVGLVKCQEAPR